MKSKIGIIGIGEIGSIFLSNYMLRFKKEDILISNRTKEKILKYKDKANILSNIEVARESDYLIIAVKPSDLETLAAEISKYIKKETLIISTLAGVKLEKLKSYFNNEVIRILPNTPCKIGNGIILYTDIDKISKKNEFKELIQGFGEIIPIDEDYMDLGSVSTGSMPAFVFKILDSYVKASVSNGMTEDVAKHFISKTFIQSINYANNTLKSYDELIHEVAVIGGSTIEGINKLEELNIENVIAESFKACLNKTKKLGGN